MAVIRTPKKAEQPTPSPIPSLQGTVPVMIPEPQKELESPVEQPSISLQPETQDPIQLSPSVQEISSEPLQEPTILPQIPTPIQRTLESRKKASLIAAIRDFCGPTNTSLLLKYICERIPEVLPNYTTWKMKIDITSLVVSKVHTPGYVEKVYPMLEIMLGSNLSNVQWTARVLVGFTVFRVLEDITESLPYAAD